MRYAIWIQHWSDYYKTIYGLNGSYHVRDKVNTLWQVEDDKETAEVIAIAMKQNSSYLQVWIEEYV